MTDAHSHEAGSGITVNLSLISHTNAGKTTLARTLLGRDVGEVRDAAHVTDVASGHVLVQSGADTLMLWDTPGFGDTARLLTRLRLAGNPIGWLLGQVWDRWRERPLWSSQQAVRNARDHADVILYLVNAAEDPAAAAYVPLEMDVLAWIGKPVVLLLNQMGPPRADAAAEVERWRSFLAGHAVIAGALPLDAFARCWVQEGVLMETVTPLLPETRRPAMDRLSRRWQDINRDRFSASMHVLAGPLAAAATDRATASEAGLRDKLGKLISGTSRQARETDAAMALLAERLAAGTLQSSDALIRLHGLSGKASRKLLERLGNDYARSEKAPEGMSAVLGGLMSGAVGGLAADLAAGGLTLGGGMIVGGILGALGAGSVARGINIAKGDDGSTVRWSEEFYIGLFEEAVLRYLAVAHFGRGRGEWEDGEHPAFWRELVQRTVADHRGAIAHLYVRARNAGADMLAADTERLLIQCTGATLAALYPQASAMLGERASTAASPP